MERIKMLKEVIEICLKDFVCEEDKKMFWRMLINGRLIIFDWDGVRAVYNLKDEEEVNELMGMYEEKEFRFD